MLYNSAMDIFLKGCDHKYAVEQMLLTLYPDERPVYPEAPGGADRVEISLRRGGKYASAVCRLSREGKNAVGQARFALGRAEKAVDAVRLEQRIVKLAFYRAALALGHDKPVWGSLTGVRPAKFFTNLMERFKGMTKHISDRLAAIFHSPEKKEEIQQPIKRSIRELLARNRVEADAANAARRAEQDQARKKKQQNRDR